MVAECVAKTIYNTAIIIHITQCECTCNRRGAQLTSDWLCQRDKLNFFSISSRPFRFQVNCWLIFGTRCTYLLVGPRGGWRQQLQLLRRRVCAKLYIAAVSAFNEALLELVDAIYEETCSIGAPNDSKETGCPPHIRIVKLKDKQLDGYIALVARLSPVLKILLNTNAPTIR